MAERSGSHLRLLDKMVSGEIVTACEAYENLRVFCDAGGGRFGGSAGEVRAREYLLEKLAEYGLVNVHTEEYSYTGWVRGRASLSVAPTKALLLPQHQYGGAPPEGYSCFSLPHSPSGDVEAELIDVGPGGPREFEAATAEGLRSFWRQPGP